jgi:hypothetical protein
MYRKVTAAVIPGLAAAAGPNEGLRLLGRIKANTRKTPP